MYKLILGILISFLSVRVVAQSPHANFVIQNPVCINENVEIDNNSTNSLSYQWDFCNSHLQQDGMLTNSYTIDQGAMAGVSLVKESGKWFGFFTNFSTNKLHRITFGAGLDTIDKVEEVAIPNNTLKGPAEIKFLKYEGIWKALVANYTNNTLTRLDFVNGLNSLPNFVHYSGLSGPRGAWGVEVFRHGNKIYSLIGNIASHNIALVDFGNNFSLTPIITTYTSSLLNKPLSISVAQTTNKVIAFIVSNGNKNIVSLQWENNMTVTPVFNQVTSIAKNPISIKVLKENQLYQAFVTQQNGVLTRLDFVNGIETIPTKKDFSFSGVNRLGVMDVNYFDSRWIAWANNPDNQMLYKIAFQDTSCSYVSIPSSEEKNPEVYFTKAGEFTINLTVYDASGNFNDTTQYINVLDSQAPIIDIQLSSLCPGVSSTITALSDQPLLSSSWVINGEAKTGNTVTYTFPTPGTYTVTLEVESEGGCGNRLTKEITIYEQPTPAFSGPDGLICTGGPVLFANHTDTKGADDLITYHWDFNGEGTSTQANPSFEFLTGGNKTVTLTASIPGCSEVYDTTFFVTQGPQVGFSVPYICQGSEVQFSNTTTGDHITAYHWDFGDGGTFTTTTADSPFYTYDSAGTFTVTLSVDNAAGCANVLSKTLTVYEQPQVSFLAEVACAGIPVTFTDLTTAGTTANIIAWEWDFGDGQGASNVRHPEYTYLQPGTYQVQLTTRTSAGCAGSYQQELVVESPLIANFTQQALCAEEESSYTFLFQDASTIGVGDQIQSWLWTINGENFTTQEVEYAFATPGTYTVSLTTFARSACNATVTRTVEVLPEPTLAFSYTSACDGAPFVFTNESTAEEGVIQRYTWDFGGVGTSFETHPQFAFTEPGTYTIRLTAETATSCTYTVEQQIEVFPLPKAMFTSSVTRGGAPLQVQFTQQSMGVYQYHWSVNDTLILSEEHPAYTFQDTGTYRVTLTVDNESGCTSQTSQVITVEEPVWDVALENVRVLSEEQGIYQILLTIRNTGTVPVTAVPVHLAIDQLLALQETFQGYLSPGEKTNFPMSVTLSSQVNQRIAVNYICATLLNGDEQLPDPHTADNRNCTSMADTFLSIMPYPNPVEDELEVSLLLPQAQPVRMVLENTDGRQVQSFAFSETQSGLNTFTLPLTALPQGQYLLQVYYAEVRKTYRLLVHP